MNINIISVCLNLGLHYLFGSLSYPESIVYFYLKVTFPIWVIKIHIESESRLTFDWKKVIVLGVQFWIKQYYTMPSQFVNSIYFCYPEYTLTKKGVKTINFNIRISVICKDVSLICYFKSTNLDMGFNCIKTICLIYYRNQ